MEAVIKGNVKVANFPFLKEIQDFDFSFQPSIDKKKIMDAAETLYKLQDSDIYHFYTTSISTEKQVDRLLKDNLDGAGRRLNGMQSERIAVDWNKFM